MNIFWIEPFFFVKLLLCYLKSFKQKLNQAESEIKIDNRVQEIVSYHQDIYDDMKKENVLLMNRIGSAPKVLYN